MKNSAIPFQDNNFKKIIFLVLLVTMTACTAPSKGVKQNYQFSVNSPESIVILGAKTPENVELLLTQFDENKKELGFSKHSSLKRNLLINRSDVLTYSAHTIKPGRYLIQGVTQKYGNTLKTICFKKNTISFQVKSGEVVYLGNMLVFKKGRIGVPGSALIAGASHSKGVLVEAQKWFDNYEFIDTKVQLAKLERTPYIGACSE